MSPSDPRNEWIQQYVDGTASAEVVAQLEAALRSDPEFRALFLEYLNLDNALTAETAILAEAKITRFRQPMKPASTQRWLAVAAVLVTTLLAALWLLVPQTTNVAVLRRAVGAKWEGPGVASQQQLSPQWIKLASGVAQIDFNRGARVVLEGPAEFQLVSDNEGVLRRGKLRAFVPQSAHGFTVRGNGFTVVDHGTEFGVIADANPEVHVFTGKVAVSGQSERALVQDEAVRISANGVMEPLKAKPERFISELHVNALEASEELSAHPAAVAHYEFSSSPGVLANRVPNRIIPAVAIGKSVSGRWPGTRAIGLQSADDRVRFVVPGEMKSLTLFAWLWIDSIPAKQASLMMSEAEQPGDVHWFLHENGGVGFAVIGPDRKWRGGHSPMIFRRENFHRWISVAVAYDHATHQLTHYLNGKAISTQPFDAGGPLRLRAVEIGNWGLRPGSALRASNRLFAEPEGYVRTLRGRVDEFAILSAPLSAQEILRLHENGQPPL